METHTGMDITKTLKKLSSCMLRIYENVNSIVNENDVMAKTNEEDLIGLVEAIENVKLIISKKKEVLRCPLLTEIEDETKAVNQRISGVPTSTNYRENHSLPEYDYQGVQPFTLDGPSKPNIEDSKVDSLGMNDRDDQNQQNFKDFNNINNYSKAVEKLGDLDIGENGSVLFGEKNSKQTDESDIPSGNKNIDFLNKLVKFKRQNASGFGGNNLISLIAKNKVLVRKGKIYKVGDDEIMQEEEKEQSQQNNSPQGSKNPLGESILGGEDSVGLNLESNDMRNNEVNNRNEDMPMEEEEEVKEVPEKDIKQEEPDVYDNLFMAINRNGDQDSSEGFDPFNEPDVDHPFNNNMRAVEENNAYKPYNPLYSCDIFESERPGAESYHPLDDAVLKSKANQKYLSKMKKRFKSTLRNLIKEKKKEKERQDLLIAKYNNFLSTKLNF